MAESAIISEEVAPRKDIHWPDKNVVAIIRRTAESTFVIHLRSDKYIYTWECALEVGSKIVIKDNQPAEYDILGAFFQKVLEGQGE